MPATTENLESDAPQSQTKPVGFRARTHFRGKQPDAPINKPGRPITTVHPAPNPASTPAAVSPRSAPPSPKRSKGSLFLSLLFLTGFGLAGYMLYSTFFQYQSYGVIHGRIITVSSPWNGTLSAWEVRDGDEVKQGQILAELSNLQMRHKLAGLGDELKMTQANLDAESSKVQFELDDLSQRKQAAIAEYLKTHGELLEEQSKMKEMRIQLQRMQRLVKNKNISKSKYEELYYRYAGHKKRIEKLESVVGVLKNQTEDGKSRSDNGAARLAPIHARVDQIQAEIGRLRQSIDQGQIRAPVSGKVTKRFCLTGESVDLSEPIVEILEDNSTEAILYVPQRFTNDYVAGSEIDVVVQPYDKPMRCVVTRLGQKFEAAPPSIERYYTRGQHMLPVYVKPLPEFQHWMALRIDGTVKIPFQWQDGIVDQWNKLVSLVPDEYREYLSTENKNVNVQLTSEQD